MTDLIADSRAAPDKPTGADGKVLSRAEFSKRVVIATAIAIAIVAVAALLWYTVRVLELIFFAILGAAFFRGVGGWVSRWSRLHLIVSITLVILILVGLTVLAVWFLSPQVQEQTDKLQQELPRAIEEINGFVEEYIGISRSKQKVEKKLLGDIGGAAKQIGTVFVITFQVVADTIIFFFLTLYLTYTPGIYIQGILKLIPVHRRKEASGILDELGSTLKWWLFGRFSMMTIVGILCGIGLWLLEIPLALTLGIIAGVFTFVPYLGPFVSAIPAILIALLVDFNHAVYVVLLYLGIHTVEGYILVPLIQERTVAVPPMLLLSALTGMTILFGIPGLVMSTPLTAVTLVLIKRLYIEGILGDKSFET